jgi:hypothetical protein
MMNLGKWGDENFLVVLTSISPFAGYISMAQRRRCSTHRLRTVSTVEFEKTTKIEDAFEETQQSGTGRKRWWRKVENVIRKWVFDHRVVYALLIRIYSRTLQKFQPCTMRWWNRGQIWSSVTRVTVSRIATPPYLMPWNRSRVNVE